MVMSEESAKKKMKERVATAGTYLKEALMEAPDAVDEFLKNYEENAKKLVAGLQDSIKTGKHKKKLEVAKARGSWRKSHERAAAHFEERSDEMVTNAMEDYGVRKTCIEKAQAIIKKMPKATRAERIKRSSTYQEEMGKCMDVAKGRKG